MADYTLDYLKKKGLPITRENYIMVNWLGDYDPSKPLPPELEAEIPEELQMKHNTKETDETQGV